MIKKSELYAGVNEGLRKKYLSTLNDKQKRLENMDLGKKVRLLDRLIKMGIISTIGHLDYLQALHNLEDHYLTIPEELY